MAVLSVEKVISALPGSLTPNTVYFVRVGAGIDIYVSDNTGAAAHKHNDDGGSGSSDPMIGDFL